MKRLRHWLADKVRSAEAALAVLRGWLERCDLCGNAEDELSGCPCGNRVCYDCQDFGVYSDEVCCVRCAAEIRGGWVACPGHQFGEPYENEDGDTIRQCAGCDYPEIVEHAEAG